MKKAILLSLALTLFGFFGCKTRQPISGYYTYDTECLGKNYDGTQILKAWGTGETRQAAQIRAYQEALQEILFEGIRNGNSDCESVPLITEADAREKYQSYFNHFFSKEGRFREFVSLAEKKGIERNNRSDFKNAYAYVIEVNIPSLKRQLQTDNIIP